MGSALGAGGGVESCCTGGSLLWSLAGGVGSGLALASTKAFLLAWLSTNDLTGANRPSPDCATSPAFLIMPSTVLKSDTALWAT